MMNVTESFLYVEHMFLYISMCFISLIALIGNGLIVLTFIQQPTLRNKGKGLYLIGCLAVGDFCAGAGMLFLSAVRLHDEINQVTDYTRLRCLSISSTTVFVVYLSHTWTALLAHDRFKAMAHPFEYHAQNSKISRAKIACVYMFALLNASCVFLGVDLSSKPESCRFGGNSHKIATLHYSFLVVALGCVVFFFYIRALIALKSSANTKVGDGAQNSPSVRAHSFEVKVTKTTVIILAIYCIVWFIPNLSFMLTASGLTPQMRGRVTAYLAVFMTLNSSLNVFVYATKSSIIRPYLIATVKNHLHVTNSNL